MQMAAQYALNEIASPRKHMDGTELVFSGGVARNITYNHGTQTGGTAPLPVVVFKGAQVLTGGADGQLMVHLVDDAEDEWFPLELFAGGGMVHAQFDAIADATFGTTVTIDATLLLFPLTVSGDSSL